MKRVSMNKLNQLAVQQLSKTLGLSTVLADILVKRGIKETSDALDFLRPSLMSLESPFCFRDMHIAVERMKKALLKQEKVLVYGDYDVDGVTSTAVLYKTLTELGFKVVAYIPSRQEEGYGLNQDAIIKAAEANIGIIITVDCGITAQTEIESAKQYGIDVIITDHHEPSGVLPEALAIINPKADTDYPFRDLAGVGVAFKLAQALIKEMGSHKKNIFLESELLDLVALGTIADIVPLVGENRIIVQQGLLQMEKTVHVGLAALLEECGLKDKTLKAGQIAFMVAPRINAAGRMDSARIGLELLLTGNLEKGEKLARELTKENTLRQETEKRILAEAIIELEKEPIPRVIVLSAENWHPGVIGIVASRLVERYYRPVFMISEDGEEGKGSARGIEGYHVLEQLTLQSELLTKFGGHRQAAGFSLPKHNIDLLRKRLNAQAELLSDSIFIQKQIIDQQVSLEMITQSLQKELEQLAPFGFGNPEPLLALKEVPVSQLKTVGSDSSHLKLNVGSQGKLEGIAFRQGEKLKELLGENRLDIAFSLQENTFLGETKVQLMIKNIQRFAVWHERNGENNPEEDNLNALMGEETAAALEQDLTENWLDWRFLDRESWVKCLTDILGNTTDKSRESALIWDFATKKLLHLSDMENLPGNEKQSIFGKSKTGEYASLGVLVGAPASWVHLVEGLQALFDRGVFQIALAEFKESSQQQDEANCKFIERDELVTIYRLLQTESKKENPFTLTVARNDIKRLEALKIFEDLQLLRCLGGTDTYLLELLPAKRKLNLDESLRFSGFKNCIKETNKFEEYILTAPVNEIKAYCETILGKGEAIHGF